jgi:hypothetical protein
MRFLRLLLWPVLYWGIAWEFAYCADTESADAPKPRVFLTAEQFEELQQLADDLEATNNEQRGIIAANGATIAALTGASNALNLQLAAALKSGDKAADEVAKLEGKYLLAKEEASSRGWTILWLSLIILALVAWSTRGLWLKWIKPV